jgi:hypothetical protein
MQSKPLSSAFFPGIFSTLQSASWLAFSVMGLLGPLCVPTLALAQTPAEAAAATPEAAPKPPPYSLPWQLRPVAPGNVVRSDTAIAFYKSPADESGSTVASTLLASYKVLPSLAPIVRLGLVSNSPPEGATSMTGATLESSVGFANPVIGAFWGPELPKPFKLGVFLGLALPFGSGGGDAPDASAAAANPAAMAARSAMDNAMFAVNYFTVFPGVGFAYVSDGFTAQAEVTVLQLTKTRGPDALDDSNTNLTSGLHLGYFFIPQLSAGVELRHQRWLSTPTPVEANEDLRDTTTVAVGPRVHLKLGETSWLRPGIALALPLDKPMTDADYTIVQVDVPFVF